MAYKPTRFLLIKTNDISSVQCDTYNTLCTLTPTFPLCPTSNNNPSTPSNPGHRAPAMKMFFHFGINEYILFHSLVPQTYFQYWLACILMFVASVGYEKLMAIHRGFEREWKDSAVIKVLERSQSAQLERRRSRQSLRGSANGNGGNGGYGAVNSETQGLLSPASLMYQNGGVTSTGFLRSIEWTPLNIRLAKSLFRFTGITLSYILMLLIMSYNVGLCLSIVLGLTVGHFMFSNPPIVTVPATELLLNDEEEEADEEIGDCCG
jgi:hypothetical protein